MSSTVNRRSTSPAAVVRIVAICMLLTIALTSCYVRRGYWFPDNAQSWTLDGIYCGADATVLAPLSTSALWSDDTDAASPPKKDALGNHAGSIGFPMEGVPNCGACPQWRIDFVSPDVSGFSQWQDVKGYTAKVLDTASMQATSPMHAQLMLRVRKPDGTIVYLIELDSKNQPVFCTLTAGQWTPCKASASSTGYTVLNVVVRTFGPCAAPQSGFFEGGVFLDDVEPFK